MALTAEIATAFQHLDNLTAFPDGEHSKLQVLGLDVINLFARQYRRAWHSPDELRRLYASLQRYTPTPRVLLPPSHPGLSIYTEDLDEKRQVLGRFVRDGHWETTDRRSKIEQWDVSRFAWAGLMTAPVETCRGWGRQLDRDQPIEMQGLVFKMDAYLPLLVKICRDAEIATPRSVGLCEDTVPSTRRGKVRSLKEYRPRGVPHIPPRVNVTRLEGPEHRRESQARLGRARPPELRGVPGVGRSGSRHAEQHDISLDPLVRHLLDDFRAALQPVEEKSTPTRLVLRYRRLLDSNLRPRPGACSPFDYGGMALDHDPRLELCERPQEDRSSDALLDCETGQPIPDGYEFAIETDDAVERPVPDVRVVRMAWHMALLISLAGAGDRKEMADDKDVGDTEETPDHTDTGRQNERQWLD
ncbi:hypothetical protein CPLU01_04002 [Colletotrichum plurivorum]|uniref:Uncharacterized protein n=1 Tax=Colletotrichum plurivorum TaxID=2175906 RepID=A0A8H6KQL9_9PEZI|nr:hypothetical protein CPLU01_04002 [Colletotrichum plurivorum]